MATNDSGLVGDVVISSHGCQPLTNGDEPRAVTARPSCAIAILSRLYHASLKVLLQPRTEIIPV
jgi:hypothetical protein